MCDTVAIVKEDRVFFAKNSDRDPNEAQSLEWRPRRIHTPDAQTACTWISIPQVEMTRAVLLSRPFWMWGAEMGANEDGVVIGNEAVFTRAPSAAAGLTGMDLVRLALERANCARRACETIIELLETWGQGGGCGHENRRFSYHNSFILVDPREAYVLETAGRHWVVESVRGARAISNGLTISPFAETHGDRLKTRISQCAKRKCRVETLAAGCHDVLGLFHLLRDHGPGQSVPAYSLINGGMGNVCMHAGGLVAAAQTTASWVSELSTEGCRHWVTATAAPCTSLFKPVHVDQPMDLGAFPTDKADLSFWWRHERFHRQVMGDPIRCFPFFQEERDALEKAWIKKPPTSEDAFAAHMEALTRWEERLPHTRDIRPLHVRCYWRSRNRRAGF